MVPNIYMDLSALGHYVRVSILSVLHIPPEKHPTENGVIAEKL